MLLKINFLQLARYKASLGRSTDLNTTTEPSDEELVHNDGPEQSIDQQSTSVRIKALFTICTNDVQCGP